MSAAEDKDKRPDQSAVPPTVADAAGELGWLVPITDTEVARAEAALAGQTGELPASLGDPAAVFEGSQPPRGPKMIVPPADASAHLARAAREGGHLTEDIEARMRMDRKSAEEQFDRENHGEAER